MPATKPKASKLAVDRAKADARIESWLVEVRAAITPLALCTTKDGKVHEAQLRALTEAWRSAVFMCSRRAGKTEACIALLLLTAIVTANSSSLYLALTSGQAKKVWTKKWKPLLAKWGRKLGVPNLGFEHNETDLTSTFTPTGATVQFGGTDDMRHVQALLGDSLAGGIAIIDEAQSDPGLIEALVVEILSPMLAETSEEKPTPGRLVIAGTVPKTPAGYYWRLWEQNHNKPDSEWSCFEWSRFDNPFLTNNRQLLDAELKRFNLTEDDPQIQQDWFGRKVFSSSATAYRFSSAKNAYVGVPAGWLGDFAHPANDTGVPFGQLRAVAPPSNVTTYAVGIDPASKRDCCAVVVWGWGESTPCYQVAEYVTRPGSGIRQDQWVDVVKQLSDRYKPVIRYLRDAGSAAEDIFVRDYKLHIEAVKKGDGSVKERVDRFSALLGQGLCFVIKGSQLEAQLITVAWDLRARDQGDKWKLSRLTPDDVTDAGSYGLEPYFDTRQPERKTETFQEMHARLVREAFQPSMPEYGYEAPPDI